LYLNVPSPGVFVGYRASFGEQINERDEDTRRLQAHKSA
jgi:hypothetical protein